ncbi:MANSC domain-containing protein 4 [Spea bombifrons]|uniref:MANSC domain-containing protein 4 n=1 Tax=Spea bombifrons TaxID=233779 RepID=UPI00234999A4|nr:MANSC domain-containing protein 4 [Spea bombifrons]
MAVGLKYMVLLHLAFLDLQGLLCKFNALCPHTVFYHDCWIRRFPGLFVSLAGSEQRGARVLQAKPEVSAYLCSRKCCDKAPCNMAVFYSDHREDNCHLVHCPQPESCLLQLQKTAVLFTITAGVDPDLLVFDKAGHVDFNPRSSLKWDRPNESQALVSSSPLPPSLPTSVAWSLPTHNDPSQPVSPPHSSPQLSPPHPPIPGDSPLRSFPPTHLPTLTTPLISKDPLLYPSGNRTLAGPAVTEASPPPLSPLGQPRPNLQSPAHLDGSKQLLNETKNHSGKNQSSDGESESPGDPLVNLWLLPGLLGSSMALLCCCSGILALGCCRRRKRGRYRPGHARDNGRGALIRCTLLKEKE